MIANTVATYGLVLEEIKPFLMQEKLYGSALQGLHSLVILLAAENKLIDPDEYDCDGHEDLFEKVVDRIIANPRFAQIEDAKELAEELTQMVATLDQANFNEQVEQSFDQADDEIIEQPDEGAEEAQSADGDEESEQEIIDTEPDFNVERLE